MRVPLEPLGWIERIASHSASEPCAAANAEPRLYSPVRLPILPRCPDEQGDNDYRGHEHQQNENDRSRNVHTDIMADSSRRQPPSHRGPIAVTLDDSDGRCRGSRNSRHGRLYDERPGSTPLSAGRPAPPGYPGTDWAHRARRTH